MQGPAFGCVDIILSSHSHTLTPCSTLFTGAGESEKSMIIKQMKIIHHKGFTRDELLTYRMTVYHNLVDSAQAIVLAMRKIGIDCETPSNRVRISCVDVLSCALDYPLLLRLAYFNTPSFSTSICWIRDCPS
jgi:hypothetical protein